MKRKAVRIGIVGPLCAGKTTVLEMFRELGAWTTSADEVNRDLLRPGSELLRRVIEEFGQQYLRDDGSLDRRALGELIFHDEDARRRLERIVHAPMLQELKRRIEEAEAQGARAVVVEAAVMYQMGADKLMDTIVRVTADRETRLRRLMERDGLTRDEAEGRLALHEKLGIDDAPADWVIDTSGGIEQTRQQVQELWRRVVGASG